MGERRANLGIIVKLIAFLALVIAVDRAIALGLEAARPEDYRLFVEAREAFGTGEGYDTLILGSSHAADATVPKVLAQALGLKAFNFAVYLATPVEWYYLARDLMARGHPPKLVIIGTDPGMFIRPIMAGSFTPEFIDDPWLKLHLLSQSFDENNLAVLFESGRRRALLWPAVKRLFGAAPAALRRIVAEVDHGYLANVRSMDPMADRGQEEVDRVDWLATQHNLIEQRRYLERLIDFLHTSGVDVVMIEPPVTVDRWKSIDSVAPFREMRVWLEEIGAERNVPIFHGYDENYLAQYTRSDFLNEEHVCVTGAWRFTRDVAAWLATVRPNLAYRPIDPTPPYTCHP